MTAVSYIHPSPPPAAAPVLEGFREVPTSILSDNLHRLSGITALRPIHRGRRLLGTALTVKVRPGDNLLVYKALTLLAPGHVLVLDGGGELTNALVGELIMRDAQRRRCAGFVIDGAVRDSGAFVEADFPCYARGISHRGPYKNGPGAIGVPVAIAGEVVTPGDLVVGDADGVVTFAPADAPALLEAARRSLAKEAAIRAEIASGGQQWIEDVLGQHGL
jgi:regulator of RNase E activity RraA